MANAKSKPQKKPVEEEQESKQNCRLVGTACCNICRNGPVARCNGNGKFSLTDEGYSSALRAIP